MTWKRPPELPDVFRPKSQPAQMIYDAFQSEAEHRSTRTVEEWQDKERLVVWNIAQDYAKSHGLRTPLMCEIETAENSAMGHIDYGKKWAYSIADLMISNRI